MIRKNRVVAAMSGGVDSSAAACILLEQGYDVIGVTMQIWQSEAAEESGCCGQTAVDDARRVADALGIPYYVLNMKKEFQSGVIDYFLKEYPRGRTPNPCVACNRFVKWGALLGKALALGADCMATGHYAQVRRHPLTGRLCIKSAGDKDQSYALYSLTQAQLEKTLLPVYGRSKKEIRELAKSAGLPVADKPDSQEICFIPDGDYAAFIERAGYGSPPGDFINESGKIIGRHNGIIRYTIGQRKGLGSFGRPIYVKKIDAEKNTVTLADDALFNEMIVEEINWMACPPDAPDADLPSRVKIRYSHVPAECAVKILPGAKIRCVFSEPQRAVTPGQAAVFYDCEGNIICGGEIKEGII